MKEEVEFINKYSNYIKKISKNRSRYNTLCESEDYVQEILERLVREYRMRQGEFPHPHVLTVIHQTCIDLYRKFEPISRHKCILEARKEDKETEESEARKLLQWHNNVEYDDNRNISPLDPFELTAQKQIIEMGYKALKSERDKRMFEMFLEDHYHTDISGEYGYCRERSRQILNGMMKEVKEKVSTT